MTDYIRDGQAIYDRSFAIIRAEADLSRIPADLEKLAVRVAHASGMVDIVDDLVFSENAGLAGRNALWLARQSFAMHAWLQKASRVRACQPTMKLSAH